MSDAQPAECPLNEDVGSINSCDGRGEVRYAYYDYNPRLWACALLVTLFTLLTVAHFAQAVIRKRWYLLGTVGLCGVGEVLGWAGRTWSSRSVQWVTNNGGYWFSNRTAFMLDPNCNSIISPAFLAACWYITLGKLMAVLGPQYSRFYPRTYGIIFVCGDLLSLIVQAFGGATAAGAATLEDANKGSNIMVIGVIIQMIVMVRFRKTRATAAVPAGSLPYDVERKARLMIMAMAISTFFVFIRSIYRTIELLNGWHGSIIRNETLFCILDAVCVLLAMVILNVLNPGWLVPAHSMTSDSKVEMENFTEESLHKS